MRGERLEEWQKLCDEAAKEQDLTAWWNSFDASTIYLRKWNVGFQEVSEDDWSEPAVAP